MAKGPKCPECPRGLPAWLATFADLMSLLLTFFVLLLSFSTTSQSDFEKALGSLQGALGVLNGEPIMTVPIDLKVPLVEGEGQEPEEADGAEPSIEETVAELNEQIKVENQEDNIEVTQGMEGIVIRIKDQAIFTSGKASVKEEILPLLTKIGAVLNRLPNKMEIEGHTDDVPIKNDQFPNNYWLSSARALSVLDVLAEEVGIEPGRMSAIGHGEHRPLQPNDSAESRAENRRVEIKVRYDNTRKEERPPDDIKDMLRAEGIDL